VGEVVGHTCDCGETFTAEEYGGILQARMAALRHRKQHKASGDPVEAGFSIYAVDEDGNPVSGSGTPADSLAPSGGYGAGREVKIQLDLVPISIFHRRAHLLRGDYPYERGYGHLSKFVMDAMAYLSDLTSM